jgi:hypothetical protein
MNSTEPFRTCTCGVSWRTRAELVTDRTVEIIGYTPNFDALALGWFFFNHANCHTTFAMSARDFADMHSGPMFTQRKLGGPECPGYCVHRDNLKPCPAQCECAWVRDVVGMLREHRGEGEEGHGK